MNIPSVPTLGERKNMPATSLLVAALVMLRRPCTRNHITASLLLSRAADDATLSAAEREACLNLVDELENEARPAQRAPQPSRLHAQRGAAAAY